MTPLSCSILWTLAIVIYFEASKIAESTNFVLCVQFHCLEYILDTYMVIPRVCNLSSFLRSRSGWGYHVINPPISMYRLTRTIFSLISFLWNLDINQLNQLLLLSWKFCTRNTCQWDSSDVILLPNKRNHVRNDDMSFLVLSHFSSPNWTEDALWILSEVHIIFRRHYFSDSQNGMRQ